MSVPARRRVLQALGSAALLPGAHAAPAANEPAPPPFARRTLRTSDGVALSALECRDAAAATGAARPTIVFLPGWCMPATVWRGQLIALARRWPALAIDPRGQGESDVPRGGYTADRRADDLHDALQALVPDGRVVLVAWSLGVLEALQYVARHGSGRLQALALVDNSIGEPPPPAYNPEFLRKLRSDRAATVERFVRSMFTQPPPESLLAEMRASALRMPLEASIQLLTWPLPREHWREVAQGFDRPLAYLVTPRFREQSEHLREARPASRVEVFEHAGHALFVDEGERFNRVLGEWVGESLG
jgi:microsomal epoxide hydrolase